MLYIKKHDNMWKVMFADSVNFKLWVSASEIRRKGRLLSSFIHGVMKG